MPALTPETATYKTKALVLPGPGQKFEVQDVYVKAKPGVSEVMVEVKAVSLSSHIVHRVYAVWSSAWRARSRSSELLAGLSVQRRSASAIRI